MAIAAWAGLACTPTFDWRELRPEGSRAQLMFPCKPASQTRRLQLAGTLVEMSMFACVVDGTTFALSFADLHDPALVAAALDGLAQGVQSHIQSSEHAAAQAASVPGMTPNARAATWRVSGRLPDGREVQQVATLFAHGTSVYQATMLGTRLDAAAQETFFGALRVSR